MRDKDIAYKYFAQEGEQIEGRSTATSNPIMAETIVTAGIIFKGSLNTFRKAIELIEKEQHSNITYHKITAPNRYLRIEEVD